jgi:hypothetical protein
MPKSRGSETKYARKTCATSTAATRYAAWVATARASRSSPKGPCARPLDQALDGPEHRLEEHRLRAGPAAPHAAEHGRRVQQAEADAAEEEEQQPDILGIEDQPEEEELPFFDIEEYRGMSADGNPGQRRPEPDEHGIYDPAQGDESPLHVGGIRSLAATVPSQ